LGKIPYIISNENVGGVVHTIFFLHQKRGITPSKMVHSNFSINM
jgi:hypothetical protein